MELRPDKLTHMDIGGTMDHPQYKYTVGEVVVQYSQSEKDLGVKIEKKL